MKKIWGLIALLVLLCAGGCDDAKETISQMRAELKEDILNEESQDNTVDLEIKEQTTAQNDQLVMPDADDITIEETYQTVQTVAQSNGEETTVQLYFISADGKSLVKEEKKIPKVEGIARATMEALLAGPEANSGYLPAAPAGTELLDINVKADDKLCIIDLSQEFANIAQEGQDLAVYAIANTLCQFETVDQVEFRIEGANVESLGTDVDLSKDVSADYSLVK